MLAGNNAPTHIFKIKLVVLPPAYRVSAIRNCCKGNNSIPKQASVTLNSPPM